MIEYTWESYRCEWGGCHEAASHTLYVNDEPVARYCAAHANENADVLDQLAEALLETVGAMDATEAVSAVTSFLAVEESSGASESLPV